MSVKSNALISCCFLLLICRDIFSKLIFWVASSELSRFFTWIKFFKTELSVTCVSLLELLRGLGTSDVLLGAIFSGSESNKFCNINCCCWSWDNCWFNCVFFVWYCDDKASKFVWDCFKMSLVWETFSFKEKYLVRQERPCPAVLWSASRDCRRPWPPGGNSREKCCLCRQLGRRRSTR